MPTPEGALARPIQVAPLPSTTGKNPYHDLFYQALEPFGVKKTDRRPWVVLGAPPVPGARLVTVPFGLD